MSVARRGLLGGGLLAIAPTPARRSRIESAIATITCDGFGDRDFALAFDMIPRIGIRNVEFNCWHPRNLTPAGVVSIARRCAHRKLRPVSLQVSNIVGGGGHEVVREIHRFLWVFEACKRLGVRLVTLTGAARGQGGGAAGLLPVLKEVVPIAADCGVRVALENHLKNVLEMPEDYDTIFSALDHPALGMNFDMAHFVSSAVDPLAVIERFHAKIIHVDIKDVDGPGRHNTVPYGTGVVPIVPCLDALVARGYAGFIKVEYARPDGGLTVEALQAGAAIAKRYER